MGWNWGTIPWFSPVLLKKSMGIQVVVKEDFVAEQLFTPQPFHSCRTLRRLLQQLVHFKLTSGFS